METGMTTTGPTDGSSHVWPMYSAKWKKHAMYEMRASIRQDRSVEDGYARVDINAGKGLESMLCEALLARAADDGQNLLMYAVRWGRENWFLHLVRRIEEQLGFDVLVKQLRAWDVNGTPLLCLAASSRSITTCFQTVYDKLHAVLGTVGVAEHVRQQDHMGRNILMHAARGNDVDVFKRVKYLYEEHQHTFADPKAMKGDAIRLIEIDNTGRNVLHHAAEAGCLEVLSEIIHLSLLSGTMAYMDTPDNNGLTPMHHLLRAKYGEPEGRNEIASKFKILWEVSGSWMSPRKVMPWTSADGQDRIEVSAQTELIHAARGGIPTLQLVLDMMRAAWKVEEVHLDEVILVNIAEEKDNPPADEELASWGWGMLLAAATKGGDTEVLEIVVRAIKSGILRICKKDDTYDGSGGEGTRRVAEAINAIQSSGSSWFRLAVLSGNVEAVLWVYRYLVRHCAKEQLWQEVSGETGSTRKSQKKAEERAGRAAQFRPLTCASSLPMKSRHHGVDVWIAVYECLREAAKKNFDEPECDTKVSEQFKGSSMRGSLEKKSSPPLTGAALSSNWVLFETIYDKFECLTRKKWSRDELLTQLGIASSGGPILGEHQAMHECAEHAHASMGRGSENITAVIWRDLVEAYERADNEDEQLDTEHIPSWREELMSLSGKAVQLASETGAFDDLRELVREGFPIHDDFIQTLLCSAEDEEDVADILMYAVANTSNPFVMAASVSKSLRNAETDRPMHRIRLRGLQQIIDDFTSELLEKLPHTVRGMGVALLRPVVPQHRLPGLQQQRRDTLALLAGYMVVEWILEPRLLNLQTTKGARYYGPNYMDPLQRALDRGSKALDFINSPLVMDYLHVKFSCTLPNWTSSSRIPRTINPGFYKYHGFDTYDFSQVVSPGQAREAQKAEGWDDFLLRFLQGWDVEDMMDEQESMYQPDKHTNRAKWHMAWRRRLAQLPHSTALPMLQFSLAGIIGKPDTFYNVPAVRFAFEFLQFLTMLVLFCVSVQLKNRQSIPVTEILFYVYMGGTLWREVLEFCDGIPARHRQHRRPQTRRTDIRKRSKSREKRWISNQSKKADRLDRKRGLKRLASTLTRYFFYDTWNLIDMLTIVTVFLGFVFRLMGKFAREEHFFAAQFFLAVSAPLLFARLLRLTQIDDTLGPMTQAPLGEFDFSEFDDVKDDCPSHSDRPQAASDAGIFLLVAYLLILAIIMLNLLVAVLTTAHGEVYANGNGEKEFNRARTRLIQQTARAVAYGRIPPPFNLVQLVSGFVADGVMEVVWRVVNKTGRYPFEQPTWWINFKPITAMYWWRAFDGMVQRFAFAFTMGLAAVALNALLWVLSMPWIAWKIVRWLYSKPDKTERGEDDKTATERGYFRMFCLGLALVVISFVALLVATAMCTACIAASGILWLRGLESIVKWTQWKWSDTGRTVSGETKRHGCPTAMPGQEHGDNWRHAWAHVAKARNFRIARELESEHFHVAPLLHSTTGSDMERLCLLTKGMRDNHQKQQQQQHQHQQDRQHQQSAARSEEIKAEPVGDTQEAAGGYLFPVQKQHSCRFSKDIVRGIETRVQSFLIDVKETEGESAPIPSFEGEGRTDREGTAVFRAADGGQTAQSHAADTTSESNKNSTGGDQRDADDQFHTRRAAFAQKRVSSDSWWYRGQRTMPFDDEKVEDIEDRRDEVHNITISGAAAGAQKREDQRSLGVKENVKHEDAHEAAAVSKVVPKPQPKKSVAPSLGISVWTTKLEEGEEYVSDEHGVRISVPVQQRGVAQQVGPGPVLLERTADVVECGEDVFFVTSIVHCLPPGTSFAEPLLIEFAVEATDGPADGPDPCKVLVRRDQFDQWTVVESTKQMFPSGRGFVQAKIAHFAQFTLADVSNNGAGIGVCAETRNDRVRSDTLVKEDVFRRSFLILFGEGMREWEQAVALMGTARMSLMEIPELRHTAIGDIPEPEFAELFRFLETAPYSIEIRSVPATGGPGDEGSGRREGGGHQGGGGWSRASGEDRLVGSKPPERGVGEEPVLSHKNTMEWAPQMEVLGNEVDTEAMTIGLLEAKLARTTEELARWPPGRGSATVEEVLSLAGKLHHAAYVIRPARYFVRRLLQLTHLHLDGSERAGRGEAWGRYRKEKEKSRQLKLTPEFMADLGGGRGTEGDRTGGGER
eukprot:g5966.t1